MAEGIDEFCREDFVELFNLVFRPWYTLVVIVTSRVSSPDDKINLIPQIFLDPVKGLVD